MGDRYLFISDIHMSDAKSYSDGSYPYFWLGDFRAALLGTFLQQAAHDNSVKQLHIVGDLFDEWVIPYDQNPIGAGGTVPGTMDKLNRIVENPINAQVIGQLRSMPGARGGDFLHYTPGNHDMVMSDEILQRFVPGAKYHPDGFLIKDINTWVEHGHNYTLFNAPDKANGLPLGFFVARTAADAVSKGGEVGEEAVKHRIPQILEGMLESQLTDFPVVFWEQVLKIAKEPANAAIAMNNLENFGASIAPSAVSDRYTSLWTGWGAKHPAFPHALLAAISDAGYLTLGALSRYVGGASESICIMGHTHYATMHGFSPPDKPLYAAVGDAISAGDSVAKIIDLVLRIINGHAERAVPEALLEMPSLGTYLYANSGTWISREAPGDKTPPATFVSVEPASFLGKQYANVRIQEYTGGSIEKSKVLYNGKVPL